MRLCCVVFCLLEIIGVAPSSYCCYVEIINSSQCKLSSIAIWFLKNDLLTTKVNDDKTQFKPWRWWNTQPAEHAESHYVWNLPAVSEYWFAIKEQKSARKVARTERALKESKQIASLVNIKSRGARSNKRKNIIKRKKSLKCRKQEGIEGKPTTYQRDLQIGIKEQEVNFPRSMFFLTARQWNWILCFCTARALRGLPDDVGYKLIWRIHFQRHQQPLHEPKIENKFTLSWNKSHARHPTIYREFP